MPIESREEFFEINRERLEHIAFKAVRKGSKPEDLVAVAIDVDDPGWTNIVHVLMPDTPDSYWQEFRDRGEKPMARGVVYNSSELMEYFAKKVPDVASALYAPLPDHTVRTLVMAFNGLTVGFITPAPPFSG
jgi:hypothetical protein